MKFYTLYNEIGEVLYTKEFEEQPENSTDLICQVAYVKPMFNKDTNVFYEGATPTEVVNNRIANEYNLYKQRQEDGMNFFLYIMAKLRIAKSAGAMTNEQYLAINNLTKATQEELKGGQWITANDELQKISQYLSPTLYNEIQAKFTQYITDNY